MKQPDGNTMLAKVVAIRLENDRKVMMALLGKGYADQVARYRSMIENERQLTQCDLLPAALNCCQRIQRRGEGDELTISMLMAAAVEMIEPVKRPHRDDAVLISESPARGGTRNPACRRTIGR